MQNTEEPPLKNLTNKTSTIGKIVCLHGKTNSSKKIEFPNTIVVDYRVKGLYFSISEPVHFKKEVKKLGFLPIGFKKVPTMKDINLGCNVTVIYNENKPYQAYILENAGHINKRKRK